MNSYVLRMHTHASYVYLVHNGAGSYSPSLSWPDVAVCVCLLYDTISRGGILVLCTLTTLS